MRKFIGSKAFYMTLIAIVLPIIIQNGISNFVNFLDNIMVGQVGTDQMSGVAIANQLMFVFNLCVFGGVSGAGIFTAQFFGAKNLNGVKETFRFKILTAAVLVTVAVILFLLKGRELVSLYLADGENAGNISATLKYGTQYLKIMLWGLAPFAMTQVYSGTLRECRKTMLPMKSSIAAVLTNLCLNYVLIYGKFGFPELGVSGAAIATVISRYVELGYIVLVVKLKSKDYEFLKGVYKSLRISGTLAKIIIIKGMPLLVNEFLWAFGMASIMQLYSVRGLAVVAALNISGTVSNLFSIIYMSMGNAVGIMVGQALGAGKYEEAKDTDTKLIFFSLCTCVAVGFLLFLAAPYIPLIYRTSDSVRVLASGFLRIAACCMPIFAFAHACYFTLRSGGKTLITFLFDSAFVWAISVPLAYCLVNFTGLGILSIYLICQLADLLKCIFGFTLVKKGIWINNMVEN